MTWELLGFLQFGTSSRSALVLGSALRPEVNPFHPIPDQGLLYSSGLGNE